MTVPLSEHMTDKYQCFETTGAVFWSSLFGSFSASQNLNNKSQNWFETAGTTRLQVLDFVWQKSALDSHKGDQFIFWINWNKPYSLYTFDFQGQLIKGVVIQESGDNSDLRWIWSNTSAT